MRHIPRQARVATSIGERARAEGRAPRIVLFSHSAGLGGAERCLLETVDALTRSGVELRVVLPTKGPLEDELRARGVPYRLLRYLPWLSGRPRRAWKRAANLLLSSVAVARAAALVAGLKPDLVFSNSAAVMVGAAAARICRTPHLWHLHEFAGPPIGRLLSAETEGRPASRPGPYFDLGAPLTLALMRRLGGAFVANSRVLAQYYSAALRRDSLPYLYQPVTMTSEAAVGAGCSGDAGQTGETGGSTDAVHGARPLRCAIVASIEQNKNQIEAVRAFAAVAREYPDASLVIAGPAREDYLRDLRAVIERAQLAGSVRVVPRRVDSAEILGAADVVLVCSRRESFGRLTIEAMKAGCAVVGARSGGTEELIAHGETGLLYEPGDPTDLAGRLRFLAAHAEERDRLAANGRAWATSVFSAERYQKQLAALLGLPGPPA